MMLEVRYEDVIADLEGQSRRIVDHCGLEWDRRCLDFHRSERSVRTASFAQVRRPAISDVGRTLAKLRELPRAAGRGARTSPSLSTGKRPKIDILGKRLRLHFSRS